MEASKLAVILAIVITGFALVLSGAQQPQKKGKLKAEAADQKVPPGAESCFELSAMPDPETVVPGKAVNIKVILKNISDRTCPLLRLSPLSYSINVKNEAGENVPMTKQFEKLVKAGVVSASTSDVESKKEIQDIFTISDLFQLNKPGKYTVTFSRTIYLQNRNRAMKITSKPVMVTVSN
jgi:hypothetical protein